VVFAIFGYGAYFNFKSELCRNGWR